jgi:hypothetical protein
MKKPGMMFDLLDLDSLTRVLFKKPLQQVSQGVVNRFIFKIMGSSLVAAHRLIRFSMGARP